jgi:SNF2 family DNA or RNA helicase
LYDPWWNPAVEAQAIDRSHRIGQTQTVNAYRLIAPGTVEEKIWELQQSKAQTIADVLGEEGFARIFPRRIWNICSRKIRPHFLRQSPNGGEPPPPAPPSIPEAAGPVSRLSCR